MQTNLPLCSELILFIELFSISIILNVLLLKSATIIYFLFHSIILVKIHPFVLITLNIFLLYKSHIFI